jgi:organic hydroperoxide reductase OsmC/OhrA
MHPYPHRYTVGAEGATTGEVTLTAAGLPTLPSAPPVEFDGPGDRWSPETLLCAALADCFVLTFRAVTRAAKLEWRDLKVTVEGTLDRPDKRTHFTGFVVRARLAVPAGSDPERYRALLDKAEHGCLISNSLTGTRHLEAEVLVDPAA